MMKMTVFGLGAAGNKACIALIESGVVDKDHVKLLNTTSRDIPDEYKDPNLYIEFLSGLGGCGKEPAKGRAAITTAIQNKDIDMGQLLVPVLFLYWQHSLMLWIFLYMYLHS